MTVARPRNPLRTYAFRVRLDLASEAVVGVRRVSGLSTTVQAHETWSGGNALHRYASPDRATWEPITLEQGLALDDSLERWAQACLHYLTTGDAPADVPVKRDVVIEVWDPHLSGGDLFSEPTGTAPVPRRRDYLVVNAWVSKLQALPALDAMSNEVGLLTVELTHDGWRPMPPAEA
ncbi:phage tail protein [Cellulomonas sp. KH9]|uniref:phage tail protein n=1 Tax=Cellulomonas sp. KH9 TaxID=1855324 RepID=UPI0008E26639|nr:phage tail protein [Cellulomonas sp. KH9]SFK01539.1 conserved hypothetical phage tail region protein [Cellulomonas sp. KH9]